MAPADSPHIEAVDAPWKLRGTVYSFPMYSTATSAKNLEENCKSFMYSPLELNSSFSSDKLLGGVGAVQIIRYTESPVGPYDELILIPGAFGYDFPVTQESGEVKIEKRKGPRITRIYVSQKYTCWNGRTNWNIPKHLAKFKFTTHPDKTVAIEVQSIESGTAAPIFKATFKPIPYVPYIPVSTSMVKYVGLDLDLVQPPLPEGKGTQGELPGTDRWCKIVPFESSSRTAIGWWDLQQTPGETSALLEGQESNASTQVEHENWWPGSGRWKIGMVMEDAEIRFPEGTYWKRPSL